MFGITCGITANRTRATLPPPTAATASNRPLVDALDHFG